MQMAVAQLYILQPTWKDWIVYKFYIYQMFLQQIKE